MADDLTAAEEAELNKFMTIDKSVPADPDNELENIGIEAPAAPAPSPAPAPAPAPTPAEVPAGDVVVPPVAPAPAAAPAGQTEDERFAAWLAQNEGKTPEELARIAFQQSNRANAASFEARKTGETLKQINDRMAQSRERTEAARAKVAIDRAAFQQRLADDPDGATAEIFERLAASEVQQIDQADFAARQDAAVALASTALPDFGTRAPQVYNFGNEMGYSTDELKGISDGRDLVVLSLAEIAGRLLKGGVIDLQGNLLQAPQVVDPAPQDPRLNAPRPQATLSSVPARAPGGSKAPGALAVDVLGLSDSDFDKFAASGELDNLMRQLND